jgi:hypothetical protein
MGSEGKKAVPGEDVEVLGQNLEERSGPHLAHLPSASPNLPGLPSLVPAAAQASGSVVRRRRSTVVGADSSGRLFLRSYYSLFFFSFCDILGSFQSFFFPCLWSTAGAWTPTQKLGSLRLHSAHRRRNVIPLGLQNKSNIEYILTVFENHIFKLRKTK